MTLSRKKNIMLALCLAIIMGSGTWFLRGVYDDVMMTAGDFHVVNASDHELKIVLSFPSGAVHRASLPSRQGQTFHVPNTGEGAIAVTVNEKTLKPFGYVTSHNALSVLTVSAGSASQTYP